MRAGFRACYQRELIDEPRAQGQVVLLVTLDEDGSVKKVIARPTGELGSAVACVRARAAAAQFDPPHGGQATVVARATFRRVGPAPPTEPERGPAKARPEPAKARPEPPQVAQAQLGWIGHKPRPCGPGADLPLSERLVLWSERLSSAGSAGPRWYAALSVYHQALRDCEAMRWDERSRLLVLIVDRLESISERVSLWQALLRINPAAADAVYRFMMLRVQTAKDLKELHQALGLERIDATMLAGLLKKANSASERLSLLRGAAERFPDDTELGLLVLDAYEDARDDAGGRAWARRLRRRVDATAHVRTSVGEHYLRLAERGTGPAAQRDAEEGRRTFGELVEFAPEDPLARRRLGDLLRAHGWYEEAFRQYETLATLTPDDPSVPLLLAGAAQGMGKVEEAVRWTEKAAATGSPDGASPIALSARALSSAYLAWARQDSLKNGKQEEAERLRTRASRLAASDRSTGVRAILTWSHPELRPALWTHALGSPMPAPDNFPLYGVAQAFVPEAPAPVLELRLDPEDAARAARLGVHAVLTVISGEGTAAERIARSEIGFRDANGKPSARVEARFDNGQLTITHRAGGEEP
jgi:Ca-activated chloride channel family protein